MKKLLLCKAFFKREWIIFRRYFFNSVGHLTTMYVIFLMMFSGFKWVGGNSLGFGDKIEGFVVGYIIWTFLYFCYSDVVYSIQSEASTGTLEQLYMSVHGFGWVMGMKILSNTLINLLLTGIMVYLITNTIGIHLNLDLVSILIIAFFTMLGALGIGFALGGLALIYKRINSYLQIVQFFLIALVAVSVDTSPIIKFIPIAWGSNMLQYVMSEGWSITSFSISSIIILVSVGVAHLLLGYGIYKLCEKKAMDAGVIGHY